MYQLYILYMNLAQFHPKKLLSVVPIEPWVFKIGLFLLKLILTTVLFT